MKPAIATLIACMLPMAAAAQEPAGADPAAVVAAVAPMEDAAALDTAAAVQNSGPMTVQRMHSTFVIAPDYKVTRFDHSTAQMLGVYGGVLLDGQWLVGAGGYWQVNGDGGRDLAYGGGIFGWTTPPDRVVGFSLRSLVGWGEARLPTTVTEPGYTIPGYPDHYGYGGMGLPIRPPIVIPPQTYQVRFHEQFFVAEPQADLLLRFASWGRIDAGVGYRAVTAADHQENRIQGATASLSLQLGIF